MSLFGKIRDLVTGIFQPKDSRKRPETPASSRPPRGKRQRARTADVGKQPLKMPAGWQVEGFHHGIGQGSGTSNQQWPDFEPYDPDGEDIGWGPGWINTQRSGIRIIVSRTHPDGSKDYGTIHGPVRDLQQVIDIIKRQPNVTVSPK